MIGLTVAFSEFVALDDLSFAAGYGRVRGVIGPNGAGKTTLLDALAGKSRPGTGACCWTGRPSLQA